MGSTEPNRGSRIEYRKNRIARSAGITELRFVSQCPRLPIEGKEAVTDDVGLIAQNNEFPLYLHRPEGFEKAKYKHVIIMINGFDEDPAGLDLYYRKPFSIPKILNQLDAESGFEDYRGNAFYTVLMPIPFHFWRFPSLGYYQERNVSDLVNEFPMRLYLGFRQLMYDLLQLISVFNGDRHVYLRDGSEFEIDKNIAIHVMGYSIGGLCALALFLLDRILNRRVLHTCTMLASGVPFGEAMPTPPGGPGGRNYSRKFVFPGVFKGIQTDGTETLDKIRSSFFTITSPGRWKRDPELKQCISYAAEHDVNIMNLFDRLLLGIRNNPEYKYIEDMWTFHERATFPVFCEKDTIVHPPDGNNGDDNRFAKVTYPAHLYSDPGSTMTIKGVGHELATKPGWDKIAPAQGKKIAQSIINRMSGKLPIYGIPDNLISTAKGTVLKQLVKAGAKVAKGTPLLILEAMKMEHEVCAPEDGSVTGFPHPEGERVMPGDLLVEFAGSDATES